MKFARERGFVGNASQRRARAHEIESEMEENAQQISSRVMGT